MDNYHAGQSLTVRAKSSRNPDPNLGWQGLKLLNLFKLCCREKHKTRFLCFALFSTKQSGVYVFFPRFDRGTRHSILAQKCSWYTPSLALPSGAQTDRWHRNHRPCLQKEAFPFRGNRRKCQRNQNKTKKKSASRGDPWPGPKKRRPTLLTKEPMLKSNSYATALAIVDSADIGTS